MSLCCIRCFTTMSGCTLNYVDYLRGFTLNWQPYTNKKWLRCSKCQLENKCSLKVHLPLCHAKRNWYTVGREKWKCLWLNLLRR